MYDEFASNYDRFVNWQDRLALEIPLIDKILEGIKGGTAQPLNILDAACGTGIHALALSKAGYAVSGADFSEAMINKARENALKGKIDVRFEATGFGTLTTVFGAGQFDAVLCLGNSLPHLLTEEMIRDALEDFCACLNPGGLLLIQNRNFDAVMHSRNRWMEPQAYQEGEGQWIFQRFYDFDPDGRIRFNLVTLHRKGNQDWQSSVTSTFLKPQLKGDLQKVIKAAGFSRMCTFGSLGGESFDPLSSGNLVLIARK